MVSLTILASFFVASFPGLTASINITDIQGPAFQSPFAGQTLQNITGVVSAKTTNSFWLAGPASSDIRASHGIRVFTSSKTILGNVTVGDAISLSARVAEFRSSSDPNDLFGTELDSPTNITHLSTNNTITPIVLGVDRSPPTQAYSALDTGPDGWLNVPGNVSLIERTNATLVPAKYGLDFWESLEGTLVTVPQPVSLEFPNSFGEFWVRGKWHVTGLNSRGGLSITIGPDNVPDANPETVIIGAPLDGTKNPNVALGTTLSDITGVVLFQFGFFYILPTTAPTVLTSPNFTVPPTTLKAEKNVCVITIGDYNIENMAPTSPSLPIVAGQIVSHLLTPDIVFLQEIQDNSGPTNDGTVSANVTLSTMANAIFNASGNATEYSWLDIDPVDGQDGGQPGGNIRQAYLYNPKKFSLVPNSTAGGSLDATKAIIGKHGHVELTFNPGRIDPNNTAWASSRKPLVAHWETPSGHRFFTINHHGTAKSGSSSTEGDARPPVNLLVDQRTAQVTEIANFVESILHLDPFAAVIVAGDFNEFAQTRSVFRPLAPLMFEADVVAGITPVERYTYVFDQNCEQLDHIFVSPAVAVGGVEVEHVHVNNWGPTLDGRASDHDPSVARVRVC